MIKAYFDTQWASVRVGMVFSKFGLTPNMWTVFSLIPALIGVFILAKGDILTGAILFSLSAAMDIIDGAVARVTNSVSNLGAFLDGVIDRYTEILLYVGLYYFLRTATVFVILPNDVWIILLVFGALMPSFIRAYSDHRGVITDRDDQRKMGGLVERFERLTIVLIGMFLVPVLGPIPLIYSIALTAILSNLTAFQRIGFVINYNKG